MHDVVPLAVWGRNDLIFVPAGATAFQRDLPGAEVQLIDGGHWLLCWKATSTRWPAIRGSSAGCCNTG